MTANHIIVNQDPQAVQKEVDVFVLDKKDVVKHYNTTPVIVGANKLGQATIIVYTTVLIQWEATEEEYKSYLFKMQTLLKAN